MTRKFAEGLVSLAVMVGLPAVAGLMLAAAGLGFDHEHVNDPIYTAGGNYIVGHHHFTHSSAAIMAICGLLMLAWTAFSALFVLWGSMLWRCRGRWLA